MITVQTIQLDDSERLALQRALGIMDKVSDIAKVSMDAVFEYFCGVADIEDDYEYRIASLHFIQNIRK